MQYLIIGLISGVLYSLGFPTWIGNSLFPLNILGLLGLLCCLKLSKKPFKTKIFIFISFSLGYLLNGQLWLVETMKEFGGIEPPYNYILSIISAPVLLIHIFLFVTITHFLDHYFFKYIKNEKILVIYASNKALLNSLIFSLIECYYIVQFPARLGVTWLDTGSIFYITAIFGDILLTAFTFYLCEITSSYIVSKIRKESHLINGFSLIEYNNLFKFEIVKILIVFLLIIITSKKYKEYIIQENEKGKNLKLNVRMVQPNIGNFLKVSSEMGDYDSISKIFQLYEKLSLEKSNNQKFDLIIWPETAYPKLMNSSLLLEDKEDTPSLISRIILNSQAELLTGGYNQKSLLGNNLNFYENEYNSSFLFGKNLKLKNYYNKFMLLEFGETLPFGFLNKYIVKIVPAVSLFAKGNEYNYFKLDNGMSFISPVCYEILFPNFIRKYLSSVKEKGEHVSFLVNLTNDSWFGQEVEPRQHLFLSRVVAIMFNIHILRSTNTGITTIIKPDGKYGKILKSKSLGFLDESLIIKNNRVKTIYEEMGNLYFFILWAILIFINIISINYFRIKPSFKRS
jgi:apolipoprotein N-acyltransferase